MNETISSLADLFINGSIPISVTTQVQTNWTQYFMTALIGLISTFGIFLILYAPLIFSKIGRGRLKILGLLTKKNVVMIKHTEQGLFSGAMIDQSCLRDMSLVMNKLEGQDFDLILHTPGGEVFSSLALSRMIKQYPGKVRAIIPLYSMSGGSLLALSCDEILMTPNASVGPIDPQMGNLFKYGSAKAWDKIVKFKGKKAEDSSISFAMMGQQYTKSIQNHLKNVVDFDLSSKEKDKLIKFLTDGNIEHAYPLTTIDLNKFGIKSSAIVHKKYLKYLIKIISKGGGDGVSYYKASKWRRRQWAQ